MAEARLTAVVETRGATRANSELNKISKTSKTVEGNVVRAEKRFKSFGKNAAAAVAAVDGPLGGISSRISSLTTLATAGGSAMTVFAIGATAAAAAISQGVFELDKLNIGLAKSEALIKATGGAAGFTAQQLQEQAQALALVTLASTEGVQKAQGILQTFDKVNGDTFTRAIELGQDLAAVYGGDVASQATQLGKALQSPIQGITALNRVGVTFSATQKDQIKLFVEAGDVAKAQEVILANLASQVGGAGASVANGSLAGALDTAGQAYTELVAQLAESSGAYRSVISLVDTLNKGLLVSAQLADENSDRNFQALVAQRVALKEEIDAIKSGTQSSIFSFLGGNSQVELLAATKALDEINGKITKIQDANIARSKAELAAQEKGEAVQKEKNKQDIAEAAKVTDAKAAKEKEAADKKTARLKESAQKELETILNLNNSELEAIDALESKRIEKAAASYAQQLISFQDFMAAKTEIEKKADKDRADLAKNNYDDRVKLEEAASDKRSSIANQSLSDIETVLGRENALFKAAAITNATIKTYEAANSAYAAMASIPIIGPALGVAAAGAAIAAGIVNVRQISSAREQGGSLSAGQSSTIAERGQLEILTPASSSRIRTKQQMQQLMGGDQGGQQSVNIVNIDQSSGGVNIETTVGDDGRIIQLIKDTTALDAANPNSELRKSFAATTNLEARR